MDRTDIESSSDAVNHTAVLLENLQELITCINWSKEGVDQLFVALVKRFEFKTKNDRPELLTWMMKILNCIKMNYITPSWSGPSGKTVIELVQDPSVTDETLQEYLNDDREKTLDEILKEIQQQQLNHVNEKLLKDVKEIVSAVVKGQIPNNGSKNSEMTKILKKLCDTAEKIHFRPRLTQMVSWCLMALSKTGQLMQIATGEGKSGIVAMFAAFRALKGEKVDIMSSSSVLAERDFEKWKKFYDTLKISVSCNTNKHSMHLKKCYESQIVYGTVEQFAGDWLRQHFERMDIFGQRQFQCAIVDEVDSLMLDKGHHTVYIGNKMPALQHLNPLLACIWATANKYTKRDSGEFVGQKRHFHQVILENITAGKDTDEFTILQLAEEAGVLPKDSVRSLRKNPGLLAEKTANIAVTQLANFFKLMERRFKSSQFALFCTNQGQLKEITTPQNENVERTKVQLLLNNGGFCQYIYTDKEGLIRAAEAEITRLLHFTPCELTQGQKIQVPGFLKHLVKTKLKVWIENAFHAQTMEKDHEYVLESHGVVPVDYSCTGVVENFTQWSDGLHQFLELKHQQKLSDMTAITNYMSNVGLLQMYGAQIYGVTGTLGQEAETQTLQKIYEGITTCQIPTFKRRKLFEVEGVVVNDEEEWLDKICSIVNAQVSPTNYRSKRAVLVICETIGRANAVYAALGNTAEKKKLYTNNNMNNTEIFSSKLEAGHVIVATNLAGRGTDLGVSEEVKAAGGLFVVQTFLPTNARVEAQAFGRTARQGAPGSAQLIICSDHLPAPLQLLVLTKGLLLLLKDVLNDTAVYRDLFESQFLLYQHGIQDSRRMCKTLSHNLTKPSDSGIKLVKMIRDHCVAEELATYLRCHIPMIKKKGELFAHYLKALGDLYTSSNKKPTESDLSALNEFWGLWLLTNFNENDSIQDLKTKLTADLEMARLKLGQRESPFGNLHHYTLFGNELLKLGRHEDSIRMYTKAIQRDKCWAAFAYYNRAIASLAHQNGSQDQNCLDQASEDLQNALRSIDLYCEQIKITQAYAKQPVEGERNGVRTRFDNQQGVRHRILLSFKENIQEAIMKVDKAKTSGGKVKVQERPAQILAPLESVLDSVLLGARSMNLLLSGDQLRLYQLINHHSFDSITETNKLESLGLIHVYHLTIESTVRGFFARLFSR